MMVKMAILCVVLPMMLCVGLSADEYEETNSSGSIRINTNTDSDNNCIDFVISTKLNKKAYVFHENVMLQATVNFIDLNGDGYEDVIVKLADDEEEYFPYILFNVKNKKFVLGVEYKCCMNYDYGAYIDKHGVDAPPEKEYKLNDIDGDGLKELVYKSLNINGVHYYNVVFHLKKDKMSYFISNKDLKDK